MQSPATRSILLRYAVAAFAAALQSAAVQAAAPVESVVLTPEMLSIAPPLPNEVLDAVDARLHAQLRMALAARARGAQAADTSGIPAVLRRGDEVLVQIDLLAQPDAKTAGDVLFRHGAMLRNSLGANRHEAWMPLDRLRELAQDPAVVYVMPARLVRHLVKTSEGVAAANANYWQTFKPTSYTGTGITIAMIDGYNKSGVSSLQSSGDWPANASVKCFAPGAPFNQVSCSSGTFGTQGVAHGNATMELAYDMAPGAAYRAYDTVTVGDWYNAILDAANVNASGVGQGAVRANVISASLGAPNDGIGDGSAQPGSIAEAAGFARARGILVVNAAGNERENHWGGAYTPVTGQPGFHSWSGTNTMFNVFGSGSGACIPAGTNILATMYWNNWTLSGGHYVASHDYDLYLYENLGSSGTPSWVVVAQSNQPQSGGTDQTPEESIVFTTVNGTTTGCSSGSAAYAIVVVRTAGTTATDNLQVFASAENASNSYPLNFSVAARSLVFPADSPNVLTVAAIDVSDSSSNPQEPFSSEGPVLASGGGIPGGNAGTDANLKPDLASYDHVTTATFGTAGFFGTSASTPQVAGMAALFMQRFGVQTTAAALTSAIVTPLRAIALTGTNDLGSPGKDYQYGNGRLRFQKDSAVKFIQQPSNALANASIAPAITVGIYDAENKLVPYTLFDTVAMAIANDPNGGGAVLTGGGNANFVNGIGTYAAAKISPAGVGYTLKASVSAPTTPPINFSVTSNAFNITTGAAAKLAFTVQPGSVQAGAVIAPALQVSVEDANGNVVNSNNSIMVTLRRASCSGTALVGGGPLTVTKGVATFSGVSLYTVAPSTILSATASGLASANSNSFAVTANPDYLFRGAFETCIP